MLVLELPAVVSRLVCVEIEANDGLVSGSFLAFGNLLSSGFSEASLRWEVTVEISGFRSRG